MLTLQRVNELLHYSPESGCLVWKLARRNGSASGSLAGCRSSNGYIRLKIDGIQYLAHRLAWLIHYSEWPSGPIDHADTDRANNSISNLRLCTNSQNQHNQTLRKSNRSGIKGVCWVGKQSKWHVQVRDSGKIHNGGYFICIDEAKTAAIQLRSQLHGEFARHA